MRYPNFNLFITATEKDLLDQTHSLGLRKRASGLVKVGEYIQLHYKGIIPNTKEELLSIPFVGNYTADAILCHAFDVNRPTYDSNFARLIDRFFQLGLNMPKQKDTYGYLFSCELINHTRNRFREFNLSILDFSDAICRPKKPKCEICSLSPHCSYHV